MQVYVKFRYDLMIKVALVKFLALSCRSSKIEGATDWYDWQGYSPQELCHNFFGV